MTQRSAGGGDLIDQLSRYAPDPSTVEPEWSPRVRDDVMNSLVERVRESDRAGSSTGARTRSRRRRLEARRPARPWLAVVAVVTLIVGISAVVAVFSGNGGRRGAPLLSGVSGWQPLSGLSRRADVGPGQYSLRVVRGVELGANGRPVAHGGDDTVDRNWVAPDGTIISIRKGGSGPFQSGCFTFRRAGGYLESPSRSFLAGLPTDTDGLNRYLRGHVSGSSSRDEAVFVAVGDMLRTADGLASPRLRAAMVAVLARTPGVTLFEHARDFLGRPALRLDFVDPRNRPGQTDSYYFSPTTFQFLEERQGRYPAARARQYLERNGPAPYNSDPPTPQVHPVVTTGTAFLELMTTERTVNHAPSCRSR